jgi:hypothetical protein
VGCTPSAHAAGTRRGRCCWPLVPTLLILGACGAPAEQQSAVASDEWARSFTPAAGTTLEIVNRNGSIEAEGVATDLIEIRAARTVRAPADQTARDVLAGLVISENTGPKAITVRTEGVKGMLIGVDWEVHYRVRVPRDQALQLRTSNGSITVRSVGAQVSAVTANGEIAATDLSGGLDARTTNGRLRVALSALGDAPVSLRATNGRVDLALPDDANALLQATATNGQVVVEGLTLEAIGEQTPRRVRGRLGEGRTPVDVTVVNGGIRISNPASAASGQR